MANNFFGKKSDSKLIFGNETKKKVDLTIVVPTYKRIDLLKETINSIINQIKPKMLTYNVILVSNDEEFEYENLNMDLDPMVFSIYRNKQNIGMCNNMNQCAILSEGTYVSYIQDDDLLLPNFLIEIEQILFNKEYSDIDCIIPNRYFYYNSQKSSTGLKRHKKEQFKLKIQKLLQVYTQKQLLHIVNADICADLLYNCFGGGPTCGITFKRRSLMKSEGFDKSYPYVFDYIFFMNFSVNNKVCLLDKYLSAYRMIDSASLRPEVQYDFFRGDLYLINKFGKINNQKNRILLYFSYKCWSDETKKLILSNYTIDKVNKMAYLNFKIKRFYKLMKSGLYRREILPDSVTNQLFLK